jgi:EcsC protein family
VARRLLSPEDQQALAMAVVRLERTNLAVRLADHAGQPINRLIRTLPEGVHDKIQTAVHQALLRCVRVAVTSLKPQSDTPPADLPPKLVAGLAGGVSGFAGIAALPIELPLTTVNMLRAIADIAQAEGEDLTDRATQMACLEVFALGQRNEGVEAGYYALRAMLAKVTSDAASFLVQCGAAEEMAPVLVRLIAEIAGRYGIIVSDRAAASAIPVLGALGGAAINWIFMDYFQELARGHFAMRRLEREYGRAAIQGWYQEVVKRLAAKRSS